MSSLPPLLHHLPNELLVDIFSYSDNKQLPLVCCNFRDIIYSTPSFWSFVYIGPKQHTPEGAAFLSKRLERGATCPLDLVIRATLGEPAIAPAIELWQRFSICRNRIRILDIGADTWVLCGQILHTIFLTSPPTPPHPFLHKLDIRHHNDLRVSIQRGPRDPHTLLRPIATLFPALTVLVLPLMLSCIPFPDDTLFSLKTLILDGSMSYEWRYPKIQHVAQLLVRAPNLETFWCKEHRVSTHNDISNLNSTVPDIWGGPRVHFPVSVSRLTKMSVVVPGFGIDLLHAINAHALQDLHFDGTRNDDWYGEQVAWLNWFPPMLRIGLEIAASWATELRRLSLVGTYLSRDTWEWLLGCSAFTSDLPFPFLESIAVHQMKAVKDQVTNVVDDALIKLYAQRGQLRLLRFAYLASEPPLGSVALQQLINSVSEWRRPGQVFELELDAAYDLDVKYGVRLILHEERPQRRNWWTLGKDIDATEDDSY